MSDQLFNVAALDLTLDHGRHRITRKPGITVELAGNLRLWMLLTELAGRYDRYCQNADLRVSVWDGYLIEDSTLWAAISELRKKLRPLDVGVTHCRGLGYRLKNLRGL